ncbi:phasin family protein [Pelagibius sp.]|uniref:phasin family protein n=1 Tax=Pelagibius sp. TaxID=1931238 RepID=UPI002629B7A8|nr:phasin family protein [Pelagibius sp.]
MATRRTTTKRAAAKKPAPAKTTPVKTTTAKAAVAKPAVAKTVARKPAKRKTVAAAPKPAAPEATAPLFAAVPAAEAVERIAPFAEEAMKPVAAAVAAGQDTLEAVVKASTQVASKGYEQAVAMTQEQVEKASSTVFYGYDEVASLGKDNMDACVQCSSLAAKGFEALGTEMLAFTQAAMQTGFTTAQALAAAKSLRELVDLQGAYSRSSFDSLVAESAKLTELSIAVTNEAMEPLQTRVTVTVEKLMKPLAA